MNTEKLFASVESNDKIMYIYGDMQAVELKKLVKDFQKGIEVKHEQVRIVAKTSERIR